MAVSGILAEIEMPSSVDAARVKPRRMARAYGILSGIGFGLVGKP